MRNSRFKNMIGRPVLLLLLAGSGTAQADLFEDLQGIDSRTYESFNQFWTRFAAKRNKDNTVAREDLYRQARAADDEYRLQEGANLREQLEQLDSAESKYREQLERSGSQADRANLIFNLGKALFLQAKTLAGLGDGDAAGKLLAAETYLRELQRSFPGYQNYPEGLYMLGLVMEEQNRLDDALQAWKQLAAEARIGIFSVRGQMRAGDALFNRERPGEALPYYLGAQRSLAAIGLPGSEEEQVRIEYRVAWSAYRSGDLSQLLRSSEELLAAGRQAGNTMASMREDAMELLADALIEKGSREMAIEWLQRPKIIGQASTVAEMVMDRYLAIGEYQDAAAVGTWAAARFGLSREFPDIMLKQAEAFRELKRTSDFVKSLEAVAILLPKESLWRARNARNRSAVNAMEENALKASQAVAAFYYERGLETANSQYYKVAASYYRNLSDYHGLAPDSVKWRLREANCRFFGGSLPEAANLYLRLQQDFSLSADQLELVLYQRVVVNEVIWRTDLVDEAQMSESRKAELAKRLDFMTSSLDDYLMKYPRSSHAMDLSLLVANANRDFQRFEVAQRYWKRALSGNARQNQVAAAVRGLIYGSIQKGDRQELIDLMIDLLRIRDQIAINQPVINEILGVLSVSLGEHGKHLSETGKLAEAGGLLVSVAEAQKDLPQRDRLLRDGTIFLAMAGRWAQVQAVTGRFLEQFRSSSLRGDMLYLSAKSLQYQLRFKEAVGAYIDFAAQAPGHEKRQDALEKAAELASAQGHAFDFARAREMSAAGATDPARKRKLQLEAVDGYLDAGTVSEALAAAEKLRGMSRDRISQLQARLAVGRVRLATNDRQVALQAVRAVEREASALAARGEGEDAGAINAWANYLLGHEVLQPKPAFDDTVESRLERFNAALPYFRKAGGHESEWGVRSRYEMAAAGVQLADDLNALAFRGTGLTEAKAEKYLGIADRLRQEAKSSLHLNIALSARDPVNFGRNSWVNRSQSLLSRVESTKDTASSLDANMNFDLPRQWSH